MASWKDDARAFFASRASTVSGRPSADELALLSGRDPRLWAEGSLYDSLIDSVVEQADLGVGSHVVELGCAAGFLARGLAPRVARYTGVDVAEEALEVARRLELPNAVFIAADGAGLPFADGSFDAGVCYDVLTNVPTFAEAAELVRELVRVVRPGGRALVGSIADAAQEAELVEHAARVADELQRRLGEPSPQPPANGAIVTYAFERGDFVDLGRALGVEARVAPVHPDNPYARFRFNVVYTVAAP